MYLRKRGPDGSRFLHSGTIIRSGRVFSLLRAGALRVFGWRFAIVLVLFYEFVIFLLAVFCAFA